MEDEAIREMFDCVQPITIRHMFGGKGIYRDGVIFALEVGGEILLKADRLTADAFRDAGARQWVYAGKASRGPVAMPYWSIPDAVVDDPGEFKKWARLAYEAGLRARPAPKVRPLRRSS